jgi:hypothetical protein
MRMICAAPPSDRKRVLEVGQGFWPLHLESVADVHFKIDLTQPTDIDGLSFEGDASQEAPKVLSQHGGAVDAVVFAGSLYCAATAHQLAMLSRADVFRKGKHTSAQHFAPWTNVTTN